MATYEMVEYQKGEQPIAEGKTKKIWPVVGDPNLAVVENKTAITAHDDPKFTRQFATKAKHATTTTCRVFELLKACEIPVAFQQQLSETEFLASHSEMVPLEIVARRLAVGSYLKRHPELTPTDPEKPHRFHQLAVEFFLKTTGKKWGGSELPTDDPLILNPYCRVWQLIHPKKPLWEEGSIFSEIQPPTILPFFGYEQSIAELAQLVRRVFLALERAWANLGITLVDIKIEADNKGRVSDVVDNDSWRLWRSGEQLDKQVFRDGGEAVLDEVERKYGRVAQLSERLQVPQQILVLWRGSEKDKFPTVPQIPGLTMLEVTLSGHKSPAQCLIQLEEILAEYPQGAVIVAAVGRSNGLGPMLAARTSVPVVAVPAMLKEFPADVWSSVRVPSNVPLLTAWPAENAVLAALNILAATNPAIYAHQQLALETLDI